MTPSPRRRAACLVLAAVLASPGSARAVIGEQLFIVSTDFSVGSSSSMELCAPFTKQQDVEPIGSDPAVRFVDPFVYVINRFGSDNVQIIDPCTFGTLREISVGPGSNPQDIAVVDDTRAFVSRYESRWLYEIDPSTGAVVDSIDLAPLADADGVPEMSMMALDGDHLFVQVQRLDRNGFFDPVPPSYLAVVDISTNTLMDLDPAAGVQGIVLSSTNPSNKMTIDRAARRLYVGQVGVFGSNDGALDEIGLDALAVTRTVTTEAVLGAELGGFAIGATKGYALISDDFFATTRLVSFSLATGGIAGTLRSIDAFTGGLALDPVNGKLYLADRELAAPGIRVFETSTDSEISGGPIDVGLPPVDFAVVRGAPVSVLDPVPAIAGEAARAAPNPFRSGTDLVTSVEPDAWVRIDVFDVGGRRVRALGRARAGADGTARRHWDGRDDRGHAVERGVYVYRFIGSGVTREGRVVRTR